MTLTSRGAVNPDGQKEEQISKYTMGVAVRLTGVEAGRIRRFEEAGLLEPKRTEGGQRLFTDSEIGLIKEIAKLEDEGANLEGIKIILAMRRGERK
jgi:DNA-binding transcriptional MerR regulator